MSEIVNIKISDIATYKKEFINIDDSKKYKRCRVQLHRKGIVLRDKITGHEIKTKKQRVCKENDFLVAEMDAKFGGYGIVPKELDGAIVSSHYYLFELDKEKIRPEYLNVLIDTDVIQNQIKAKGSTNYSRVSPSEVSNFEIPCPTLEKQNKVISQYLSSKEIITNLKKESNIQSSYLSLLRQSILQEAIEGKLTAEWRKNNPVHKGDPKFDARTLLEKIKEEKERMISKGESGSSIICLQLSTAVFKLKFPESSIASINSLRRFSISGRSIISALKIKISLFIIVMANILFLVI